MFDSEVVRIADRVEYLAWRFISDGDSSRNMAIFVDSNGGLDTATCSHTGGVLGRHGEARIAMIDARQFPDGMNAIVADRWILDNTAKLRANIAAALAELRS